MGCGVGDPPNANKVLKKKLQILLLYSKLFTLPWLFTDPTTAGSVTADHIHLLRETSDHSYLSCREVQSQDSRSIIYILPSLILAILVNTSRSESYQSRNVSHFVRKAKTLIASRKDS